MIFLVEGTIWRAFCLLPNSRCFAEARIVPSTRTCKQARRRLFGGDMNTLVGKTGHAFALYGNTPLERVKCPECGGMSFVKHGKTVCCDAAITTTPKKFYREAAPALERKRPHKRDCDRILLEQEGRCYYCGSLLGDTRHRKDKPLTLKTNWDHRIPWVLSLNNNVENFVAACHICNGIKSDKVFRDADEARTFIALRRKSKGYDF